MVEGSTGAGGKWVAEGEMVWVMVVTDVSHGTGGEIS
jgi:hypothetical protein